jgi:hypothetical protein
MPFNYFIINDNKPQILYNTSHYYKLLSHYYIVSIHCDTTGTPSMIIIEKMERIDK